MAPPGLPRLPHPLASAAAVAQPRHERRARLIMRGVFRPRVLGVSRFQLLSGAQWSLIEELLPRPNGSESPKAALG